MKRLILFTGMLSVLLAACSISAPTATSTPTIVPTIATSTPTVIPTSTPVQLSLRVKDELVNCRFGPGTGYETINELPRGETARVIGRNEASSW